MDFRRRTQEPTTSGYAAPVGAIGKFLAAGSIVAVGLIAASGISGASGVVQPTITTTNASFVIPQGPSEPVIGTTWMLKLQDLTSTKVLDTTTFTTTESEPTSTLNIAVPTVAGCDFQVDVRTTPPGVPVTVTSGTFYSDLIMMVPDCGPPIAVITPTTTTTTTTTTSLPTVAAVAVSPPVVAAASTQLPFTDASVSTTAATTAELPFTGADYPLLGGLGVLLVGLGLLLMRRRDVKLLSVSQLGESDPDQ